MSSKKDFNNTSVFGAIISGGAINKSSSNTTPKDNIENTKSIEKSVNIEVIKNTDTYNNTDKYTHVYTDELPTKETKSKRLNLLIYPSLHEDLERIAKMQAIKVNELVNRVLKEYTEREESQKMIENHKQITRK